jgi:hypothetical protein
MPAPTVLELEVRASASCGRQDLPTPRHALNAVSFRSRMGMEGNCKAKSEHRANGFRYGRGDEPEPEVNYPESITIAQDSDVEYPQNSP